MQFFILYLLYIDKEMILKELLKTNVLLKYINSENPS